MRHGETVGNSTLRYYGRTDVALSESGRRQMLSAGRLLRRDYGLGPGACVFASPLGRAVEGARLVAGPAVWPVAVAELTEIDFGWFEGLSAGEIRARFPLEFQRWQTERSLPNYRFPGGESRRHFEARVAEGLQRMLALWQESRPPSKLALLVAHRGVIRLAVRLLAGLSPQVELGSIQVLELAGRTAALAGCAWRALALDVTGHLADVCPAPS